jgi:hypothetical protein
VAQYYCYEGQIWTNVRNLSLVVNSVQVRSSCCTSRKLKGTDCDADCSQPFSNPENGQTPLFHFYRGRADENQI